ncbi:MAG: Uma2 family endonuclease [Polyangiaceae bacterium]
MAMSTERPVVIEGIRYVRAPVPLHFPVEEEVPETRWHLQQRTLLFEILRLSFGAAATIGCDQFVYWDPTDPRQCLAPDAFVRLGVADEPFSSWKVWERGAPEVAVEIISRHDARDANWNEKVDKYRRLGVRELVRFEAEEDGAASLRVWDALENDLVERDGIESVAQSRVLPGAWVVVRDSEGFAVLRLSRDTYGKDLYPTPAERAERRVRELEAELARRGG